jgi:hypothetical protein
MIRHPHQAARPWTSICTALLSTCTDRVPVASVARVSMAGWIRWFFGKSITICRRRPIPGSTTGASSEVRFPAGVSQAPEAARARLGRTLCLGLKRKGRNPFGVGWVGFLDPRVGAGCQPWAMLHNAFGVTAPRRAHRYGALRKTETVSTSSAPPSPLKTPRALVSCRNPEPSGCIAKSCRPFGF